MSRSRIIKAQYTVALDDNLFQGQCPTRKNADPRMLHLIRVTQGDYLPPCDHHYMYVPSTPSSLYLTSMNVQL